MLAKCISSKLAARRCYSLWLLILGWAAAFANVHPLHAQDAAQPRSIESIRAILERRIDVEKQGVGIVVGIIDAEGERVVGYGETQAGNSQTPNGQTLFEIGSVTKVLTGLLLADMVERGEVKLDDPVAKYLPADVQMPREDSREITLLDLATHRSGLPRLPSNLRPKDILNPYADYSVPQLYEFLSDYRLKRKIGEKFEYSNLGVGLLGHALARQGGIEYEAMVRQRICGVLEMPETVITLTPDLESRLARGHDAKRKPVKNWDIPTLAGAGAFRSTAVDMLKFVRACSGRHETPLRPAIEAQMKDQRPQDAGDNSVGLGWIIQRRSGREMIWHNGGTGGYHSFVGINPTEKIGVVVLANSSHDIDDIGRHLVNQSYPLRRIQPPKNRVAIEVSEKTLQKYVGKYELTPDFAIAITLEGSSLSLQATGQNKFPLFAESDTEFFLKVVDAQISFHSDADGQITHLTLHQNGLDQVGKRVTESK